MKKVSKNFLSLFLSDAASRILGFIAVVYIARTLTIEGFGFINYGLAFLTYALLFANPGLTTIGAREIAKDRSNRKIIDEILGLKFVLSGCIFLIFIIGLLLIPGHSITKKVILLYLFSLFPFALLLEFVFQGREEMEFIGISRLVQYSIYITFIFLLLKTSRDIVAVPVAFLIGYGVASVFLLLIFLRKYKSIRVKFSFRFWRKLLAMSTPVGLATILNSASLNLPPIILGVVYSKIEVGAFSAGYKVIVMLLIIERVFHYVFFPVISKQFAHAPEKLKSSFSFLTRILFALTIPLTLGGIVLAPNIISVIYGAGYESAVTIFRILLLYFLIAPINSIFGYGLVSIDKEQQFLKVITITVLLNCILIVLLGIYFRTEGVAAALFISEMVGIILMNKELKRFVQFSTLKYITKPLVCSVVMSVILYALKDMLILISLFVGLVVYVVLFFLIRGFSREDLENLRQAIVQK